MVEKRRSWRIEHDGEVDFHAAGGQWPARFVNLSEGGCLICVASASVLSALEVAKPVLLDFKFPNDEDDRYRVGATVSHFRDGGEGIFIGLSFSDPNDECVARIAEFIEMFTVFA